MATKPRQFRIPDDLLARVDAAKGEQTRTEFLIGALEQALRPVDRPTSDEKMAARVVVADAKASLGNVKPHPGTCRCPECKEWLATKGWV